MTWAFVRGAVGNRTPDPLHAMEMLYQLSYSPVIGNMKIPAAPAIQTRRAQIPYNVRRERTQACNGATARRPPIRRFVPPSR